MLGTPESPNSILTGSDRRWQSLKRRWRPRSPTTCKSFRPRKCTRRCWAACVSVMSQVFTGQSIELHHVSIGNTLPESKSNINPENQWLEDKISLWGPAYFQGRSLLVSGSVHVHSWSILRKNTFLLQE